MSIFAIDPGPTQSAYVHLLPDMRIAESGIEDNEELARLLQVCRARLLAIEMIASYGMPVGSEVFETCVWIGRFVQASPLHMLPAGYRLIPRRDVKLHLCGLARAKDANIRQRLIDIYGGKDKAIGKMYSPGPLYGFRKDMWAALAVAITASETPA